MSPANAEPLVAVEVVQELPLSARAATLTAITGWNHRRHREINRFSGFRFLRTPAQLLRPKGDSMPSNRRHLRSALTVAAFLLTLGLTRPAGAAPLSFDDVTASCNASAPVSLSTSATTVCTGTVAQGYTITYTIQNSWSLTNQTTTLSSVTWTVL